MQPLAALASMIAIQQPAVARLQNRALDQTGRQNRPCNLMPSKISMKAISTLGRAGGPRLRLVKDQPLLDESLEVS
jgi:hypothetical protein